MINDPVIKKEIDKKYKYKSCSKFDSVQHEKFLHIKEGLALKFINRSHYKDTKDTDLIT